MRNKLLLKNAFTSLFYQVSTIICGFILPGLIIKVYGSEVNGLYNSVNQFLHIIAFLEMGLGAVVQSALYKPLAEKDDVNAGRIFHSASRFFNRIMLALLIYTLILVGVYPLVVKTFGFAYTAFLIAILSFSYFSQYYFGIVDGLFLTADQRGYIQFTLQSITMLLNTVVSVVLIKTGFGIHAVKLSAAVIFLLRPVVLKIYIKKHYNINKREKYETEPINQKWNGIAQHIAAVVLDGTDNVVLTLFASLPDVSIYSVYHLVLSGVKNLSQALASGTQALFGELWAKRELDELKARFGRFEWLIHNVTVFVFGCTGMLIVPFVQVYTKGVDDANYIVPLFAALITVAEALHNIRLPYLTMVLACGHYKQTQHNFIIAASVNIVISIVMVKILGLVGVAIGTLVAMTYQTVWMAWYNSRNLLCWPMKSFLKYIMTDAITVGLCVLATFRLKLVSVSYLSWVLLAVPTALIWMGIIIAVNLIFNFDKIKFVVSAVKGKVLNRQS